MRPTSFWSALNSIMLPIHLPLLSPLGPSRSLSLACYLRRKSRSAIMLMLMLILLPAMLRGEWLFRVTRTRAISAIFSSAQVGRSGGASWIPKWEGIWIDVLVALHSTLLCTGFCERSFVAGASGGVPGSIVVVMVLPASCCREFLERFGAVFGAVVVGVCWCFFFSGLEVKRRDGGRL